MPHAYYAVKPCCQCAVLNLSCVVSKSQLCSFADANICHCKNERQIYRCKVDLPACGSFNPLLWRHNLSSVLLQMQITATSRTRGRLRLVAAKLNLPLQKRPPRFRSKFVVVMFMFAATNTNMQSSALLCKRAFCSDKH